MSTEAAPAVQTQEPAPEATPLTDVFAEHEPGWDSKDAKSDFADEPAPEVTEPESTEPATDEPASSSDDKPDVQASEEPDNKRPPEGFVPKQALQEERRRRQELAERLARVEGRLEATPNQAAPVDPKAETDKYFADPVGYIRAERDAAKREALEEFRSEDLNRRIRVGEQRAIKNHDDFHDVAERFSKLAETNKSLLQEAALQDDPIEWAYQHVKSVESLNEIGDVAKWKESEREKMRKELEAEIKTGKAQTAADNVTPTLADSRSVGNTTPAAPTTEDAHLRDIFGED